MKDLATEAMPSFTCSITEGCESEELEVVVVVGAGSPANLGKVRVNGSSGYSDLMGMLTGQA